MKAAKRELETRALLRRVRKNITEPSVGYIQRMIEKNVGKEITVEMALRWTGRLDQIDRQILCELRNNA